jgi:hypothetical protein
MKSRSTTTENASKWFIHLCPYLEKAEHKVYSLALIGTTMDGIEIDVMELRPDYKEISQMAATLVGELSSTLATKMEEIK